MLLCSLTGVLVVVLEILHGNKPLFQFLLDNISNERHSCNGGDEVDSSLSSLYCSVSSSTSSITSICSLGEQYFEELWKKSILVYSVPIL